MWVRFWQWQGILDTTDLRETADRLLKVTWNAHHPKYIPSIHLVFKYIMLVWLVAWFMVFTTTFNNISVISWRSVLLVEEIGMLGENYRPAASHWQTSSHNVVSSTHRTHNIVAIDIDCIGSCKSNNHTITTAPVCMVMWKNDNIDSTMHRFVIFTTNTDSFYFLKTPSDFGYLYINDIPFWFLWTKTLIRITD